MDAPGRGNTYKPPLDNTPLILIVDDDRDIRELTAEYLHKHGLRTALAADGAEMFRQLAALRVDLIVLDLMMPGEDGLSVCRRLRACRSSCSRRAASP